MNLNFLWWTFLTWLFCQLLCVGRSEVAKVVQAGEMKPISTYWLCTWMLCIKWCKTRMFLQLGLGSKAHDIMGPITVKTTSYLKVLISSTSTVGNDNIILIDWVFFASQSIVCCASLHSFERWVWKLQLMHWVWHETVVGARMCAFFWGWKK